MPENTTRYRVLLIDDEEITRMVVGELLAALGYEVVDAETGKAGLELLQRERIDVVITDFGLDDMTGVDVAEALRQRHPGLPVVLITGWDPGTASLRSEIFDGVILKPCQLEDLDETLERILPPGRQAA
jgi:CheY-like chemotaxis protein